MERSRYSTAGTSYLEHIEASVGPLGCVDQLDLAAGGHDNNLGGSERVEETQLAGFYQALDGVHAPHDTQVVHHQESGPRTNLTDISSLDTEFQIIYVYTK